MTVYSGLSSSQVKKLSNLADNSFKIGAKPIDLVQEGEMESIVGALEVNAQLVIDERTLRLLIENSAHLNLVLESRFQKKVSKNSVNIKQFIQIVKDISIFRSAELLAVAYKLGLLNSYLPQRKDGKTLLIDSVLWAVKYNGCAITEQEIAEIKQELLK